MSPERLNSKEEENDKHRPGRLGFLNRWRSKFSLGRRAWCSVTWGGHTPGWLEKPARPSWLGTGGMVLCLSDKDTRLGMSPPAPRPEHAG